MKHLGSGRLRPAFSGFTLSRLVLAMVTALGLSITLVPGIATADEHVIERSGSLSDGTPYLISIPSDWNGVLINDLDYVTRAQDPAQLALLEKG